MTTNVWTHPEHCIVAVVGTVLNFGALVVCVLAFSVVTWFSSNRHSDLQLKYTLMHMDVDCGGDTCTRASEGSISDWQKTAFNLIFAGLVNNSITTSLLLFVFWPLVVFRCKVFNPLLVACRVLDFVGAYFKVVGACVYMCHAHNISEQYVSRTHQFSLRLEFLPLALLLVSFLMEMTSFVFLLVSTDRLPRTGGLTHRERLGLEQYGDSVVETKRVSYMPDPKESHMRLLSQIQLQALSKRRSVMEEGTAL